MTGLAVYDFVVSACVDYCSTLELYYQSGSDRQQERYLEAIACAIHVDAD